MNREIDSFIEKFIDELEEENAAIFAGAGLSVAAGFVNWKDLLSPIARELGLDIDKEQDLVSLAQFHCNYRGGNRHTLNQLLLEKFCQGHSITENHQILARLPIQTYWTTNYDRLIEKSLEQAGKHGDVEHPDEAVLTKDDYERYQIDRGAFVTALSGDLVSKTFLFIGFSFTDPNLDYILSRIRINHAKNQREHYCIFKKIERINFQNEEDFQYAALRQNLNIEDLKRFGIRTLLIDKYSDITKILCTIESRYRQRAVLISGSAYDFGNFPNAEEFIQKLSTALIENGNKIVSGFGLGVGSHVITGALKYIYHEKGEQLNDQLILRPFPQGDENVRRQWEVYRQEMVSYAGVAIFIFGNKLIENQVNLADGVRREFDIALNKGLKLIPIGATGFVARELWDKVMENFEAYYPQGQDSLKPLFSKLGETNDSLIETVIKIISMIKRV
jgi:hypothetical protein